MPPGRYWPGGDDSCTVAVELGTIVALFDAVGFEGLVAAVESAIEIAVCGAAVEGKLAVLVRGKPLFGVANTELYRSVSLELVVMAGTA